MDDRSFLFCPTALSLSIDTFPIKVSRSFIKEQNRSFKKGKKGRESVGVLALER